jgi:primosomal protein N' (replication factor Y) (superfamily II helicase)
MTKEPSRLIEVCLFASLRKPLAYRAPASYSAPELLGRRVIVPVGRRKQLGIVTGLDAVYAGDTKPIDSFADLQPVMNPSELQFCRFVAEYYFASLAETVKSYLPQALTARMNQTLVLLDRDKLRSLAESGDKLAAKLLALLRQRNTMAAQRAGGISSEKLNHYREQGIVDFRWQVREGRFSDVDYLVRLSDAPVPDRLGSKEKAVLAYLEERGVVDLESCRRNLKVSRQLIVKLAQKKLLELTEKPPFVDLPSEVAVRPFELNEHQQIAAKAICESISASKFAPFLLHGVTSSGKTEVYIAAIETAISLGKTVIIIVPEIGLSQAIYYRLEAVFGKQLGLIHSRLSARARLDIWQRARSGDLRIILGPRSAVFAPLLNVGLIVVDEEHDQALKQSSPAPRYHGRDLAVYRAQLEQCTVVLGSATPSIESYYNAVSGKYRLLELPQRIDNRLMPQVTTVDLREQFKKRGFAYLSDPLTAKITETMTVGGQVMLLLNRRGFAPSVHCFDCGVKISCKNCAVSLVYHKGKHRLICHLCGYDEPYPEACPSCGSNLFLYKGVGTEKLEEELHRRFPDVTAIRIDLDSTRKQGSFEDLYHRFKSGRAQILIGTQMISKGFDFPDVALVGIISADTALEFPDFRVRERAFQLLTQASGRAGRLNFAGEVLLQTLHPDDPVIALATKHNYIGFYEREIAERRDLSFPPFAHLILIEIQSPDASLAESVSKELRGQLAKFHSRLYRLMGPIAAPVFKRRTLFRFHLLLKTTRVKMTLSYLGEVLSAKEFQRCAKLNVIVDVDAVDMM